MHILSSDQRRGAQTYARALCDALSSELSTHVAVTLYSADQLGSLRPDFCLDVRARSGLLGLWNPVAWGRLRRLISRERPDMVVCHGSAGVRYIWGAARSEVPLVYLRIGVDSPQMESGIRRVFYRVWQRRVDVLVGVSRAALAAGSDLGLRKGTVQHVIFNGRNPDDFGPAPTSDPTVTQLTFVGQLEDGKRPLVFCDLIRDLRAEGASARGVLVGDGPLANEVARRTSPGIIDALGRRDDVPDILRGTGILVLCSRPPEGMPGVLIEAGMSGVPAVSTLVPGAADVIVDGETGILVDVDDYDALLAACRTLVNDPQLRTTMGSAARTRCVENFDERVGWVKWQELIEANLPAC